MKVAVVGLGKIGLPLAVHYARQGNQVVGVDISSRTVELVNAGEEPFPGEARLQEYLAEVAPSGALHATTDFASGVGGADVVIVVVPLVVDAAGTPDFGMLDRATEEIAANLSPGALVIYETTMPVGVTRTRWTPALEAGSGLVEGRDFHVVYSPERVLTGRIFEDLRKYPKVIGGLSPEGARLAAGFYEKNIDFIARDDLPRPNGVWDLGTPEAAELTKLAETTYRDVNIALANQFAMFAGANGIDVYQVIEAANSQPYSHIHRPGISVGGHCIPVYPRLYLAGDPDAVLVREARATNAAMPDYCVAQLEQLVGQLHGLNVAVLGATYRRGVKETAFSGVFAIAEGVEGRGGKAFVHDAILSADEISRLGLTPYTLGTPIDAVIVHTDHRAYADLTERDVPGAQVILDGRGVLRASQWPTIPLFLLGRGRAFP